MHILHFFFGDPYVSHFLARVGALFSTKETPKDMEMTTGSTDPPSTLLPFPVSLPVANRQINKQVVVESKVQTDRQSWLGWGSDWKLGKLKGNCTFQFRIQIFPRFYWVFIWKGNKFIIDHYYYLLHCLYGTSCILDIDQIIHASNFCFNYIDLSSPDSFLNFIHYFGRHSQILLGSWKVEREFLMYNKNIS